MYYILIDKDPIPVSLEVWGEWFSGAGEKRVVGRTNLADGKRVSTVFLGVDHNFTGGGPPDIFETMVFDERGEEIDMERCSTYAEAEELHKFYVKSYGGEIIVEEEEALPTNVKNFTDEE